MHIATELFRAAIKSDHRFNYEEIDEYLANDRPWKKKPSRGNGERKHAMPLVKIAAFTMTKRRNCTLQHGIQACHHVYCAKTLDVDVCYVECAYLEGEMLPTTVTTIVINLSRVLFVLHKKKLF